MGSSTSEWAESTVEHTFAKSGRTAVLRPSLSLAAVGYDAIEEVLAAGLADPEADEEDFNARVGTVTVKRSLEALFVRPRLVWADTVPADLAGELEDGTPKCITVHALGEDTEEALTIAQEGMAAAARFRDGGDGSSPGDDGEDVGDTAKPARRATRRKRERAST